MHYSIRDLTFIVLGIFIESIAVAFLVLPNNILTGGVSGVSVALQPVFHVDPVYMINGLIIGLYILGLIFLGKEFALKSLISTIISPCMITGLSFIVDLFPEGTFLMPDYLASIYAGVLMGIGLGFVFYANASTGGMDIPALIIHKYFKIPSGNAVMLIDGLTVMLGIVTYGLIPALTGIISVYICGKVINKTMMVRTTKAKNLLIISDKAEAIGEELLNKIDRGVTFLKGEGGYTKQEKKIILSIIDQKQYPMIEKKILEIDPYAFFIVYDINQVYGEGFTYKQIEREDIR